MNETKDWPLMLSLNQVEAYVGIPTGKLRKWLMYESNDMPFKKLGGRYYVNKFKLLDWLDTDLSHLRAS